MMLYRNFIILIFTIISIEAYAQIQISFPVSRIVLQRNNQNQANVNIAGSYLQQLDRIDARAIPVFGGQGNQTDWITIQNTLNSGVFNGSITLNGGWYNIELRGVLNGNVVTTNSIERVGIGEVFIVSGQSNAQGDASYGGGANGAVDDRVSVIDYYDATLNENTLPFQFSHMDDNKRMSPYNYVPWFWSRLGDKLVQKLNVPILFYGSALGGLGSEPWRRSAEGFDLRQELPTFVKVQGMPYRGLQAALQKYVTRTGVRAILWQQGESDENTAQETYYNNIKSIIDKSRNDAKKGDLAWVIARSSRNPITHQNVINGQNLLIQRIPNVFSGPTTDDIVGSNFRADGIHFFNNGLVQAAEFWNNSLNDSFFNSSQPLLARDVPKINLTCNTNSNNRFTISVNGGYSRYSWSNGSSSNFINVNGGSYTLKVQDDVGNTFFSQNIIISSNNNVVQPNLNVGGSTTFCEGGNVALSSNLPGGNFWSNGERGQTIFARNSGTYNFTNYTINGCQTFSGSVNVNVLPQPQNSIIPNKSLPICPDDSITLSTNNFENVSYFWNTNANSQKITVKNIGTYSLKIRGQNGCESTSFIDVTNRQRPVTNVTADGPTTFCLGKSVNLTANGDFAGYNWSNGSNSKSTTIRNSGNYTLRVRDNFGCLSNPVSSSVTVNALPSSRIIATGVEKFCDGNIVNLKPSLADNLNFQWNTGEKSTEINVGKPGLYTLVVKDNNGCESRPDSINLKYIPPPNVSITSTNNANTICRGSSITLTGSNAIKYSWSNGSNSNNILVDKAGIYTLKIRDDKNCESDPISLEIFVKETPDKPSIFMSGAYELEAIPSSLILGQYFEWKANETTLPNSTSIIKANTTAAYSVRAALKYPNTNNSVLVCYSPASSNANFVISPNEKGMRLYPNPNPTGKFYLESLYNNENATVYVFSITGVQMLFMNLANTKEKKIIDLSSFEKGIYIIRLVSSEFSSTSHLFVKY